MTVTLNGVQDYRNNRVTRLADGDGGDPSNPWYLVRTRDQAVLMRERSHVGFGWGADGQRFQVRFHVTEDGVRVRQFSVEAWADESLTAKAIKSLKIGDIVRFAFEEVAVVLDSDLKVRTGFVGVSQLEVASAMDSTKRPRGRPRSTGDDEYQRAAKAYRKAAGKNTSQAVADELGVSLSTARKRVMGARERGYLPPTGGTTRPKIAT